MTGSMVNLHPLLARAERVADSKLVQVPHIAAFTSGVDPVAAWSIYPPSVQTRDPIAVFLVYSFPCDNEALEAMLDTI